MTDRQAQMMKHFNPDRLVHCAFRYFLGRRTIATTAFARDLAEAWTLLESNTAKMIRRELQEEFERDDRARADKDYKPAMGGYPLGHVCDRAAWALVMEAGGEEKCKDCGQSWYTCLCSHEEE